MSEELKPCPFCGSARVRVHEGSTFRWVVAECDECGAQCEEVRIQTLGEGTREQWLAQGKREAIAAWNRRPAPPAAKAVEMDAQDAARYRWLRAGDYHIDFARSVLNDTPHGIDAAIDAAMGGNHG